MEYLKKLPKEIRERIYGYVVMPLAPLDPYPVTDVVIGYYNSVGLARRNKSPSFQDEAVKLRCQEADWPMLRESFQSKERLRIERQIDHLKPHSIAVALGKMLQVWVAKDILKERCGLLDYFKESEH